MLNEDNLTSQIEEIEALTAIYNNDITVVNESKRQYEIKITDGFEKSVVLEITLPDDYPASSPPQYLLHAVWLKKDERILLENNLADIFMENIGDSILYLWIEKIREFIQEIVGKAGICNTATGASRPSVEEGKEILDDVLLENIDYTEYKHDYNKTNNKVETGSKCPEILHGSFVHDRKSVFQAHLAPVHSEEEVKLVVETLLQNRKIKSATHNIQAYRICKEGTEGKSTVWLSNCKDDGEAHAGTRVLHLMEILEATNVLVVISRWYGGIQLGPDRFKHINSCARTLLDQAGYIKNKTEKKGPKSNKKSR